MFEIVVGMGELADDFCVAGLDAGLQAIEGESAIRIFWPTLYVQSAPRLNHHGA